MLKRLLLTLLIAVASAATPTLALAHTLKSDGSIGAVIHVDPEDDPIIGEKANFFFEFKDKDNKFVAEECSCLITITKDGQELLSEQLDTSNQNPSLNSSSFSFTFPEKGVYSLTLTGNSTNAVSFSPFKLTYDLRVDREAGQDADKSSFIQKNLHFLLLGGILVAFLITLLYNRRKKNDK